MYANIFFLLKDVANIIDLELSNWIRVFSLYESKLEQIEIQSATADKLRNNGK